MQKTVMTFLAAVMVRFKNLAISFAIIALTACGGGGGGGSASLPMNESGYPDVSGSYNFVYKATQGSCSNGAKVDLPSVSENVEITQSGNTFTAKSDGSMATGTTILEISEAKGYVQKNGDFTYSYTMIVQYEAFGVADISVQLNGTFKTSGVDGTAYTTFYYRSYKVSCSWNPPFEGTKL